MTGTGDENMKRFCSIACLVTLLCAASATAAVVATASPTTVSKIMSYQTYGEGDVIVDLAVAIPGCDGAWLSKHDPVLYKTSPYC